MTQINQSERDMVSAQEVSVFPVKADEQGTKLIDPGETALIGKTPFVDLGVEQAFAPALGSLTIAFVFSDVGNDAMIETDLARITGIEGTVGVEKRTYPQKTA